MLELVDKVAEEHQVEPELVNRLIEYEKQRVHLKLRRGATEDLRRIIEDYIQGSGK